MNSIDMKKLSSQELRKYQQEVMKSDNPIDNVALPPEIFTEELLKKVIKMYMLSVLQIHGLENHQNSPNFDAINYYLSVRYKFWDCDIPHNNFFPC